MKIAQVIPSAAAVNATKHIQERITDALRTQWIMPVSTTTTAFLNWFVAATSAAVQTNGATVCTTRTAVTAPTVASKWKASFINVALKEKLYKQQQYQLQP